MSRLSAHKQRENNKKLIQIMIGFLLILIIFFTFGFNILINMSLFINNLFSGNKATTTQKTDDFYGTIYVDDLPIATNSAQIYVSGEVSNFDKVVFYINNKKVKEKKLSGTTFSEKIGDLKVGDNNITVKAIATKEQKEKESEVLSTMYKKEKLKLEISEPQDKATVTTQDLKVVGQTDPETTVQVNGSPAVVAVTGRFQATIRLKEGEQTITVIAEDIAGNVEKKEFMVTYRREE